MWRVYAIAYCGSIVPSRKHTAFKRVYGILYLSEIDAGPGPIDPTSTGACGSADSILVRSQLPCAYRERQRSHSLHCACRRANGHCGLWNGLLGSLSSQSSVKTLDTYGVPAPHRCASAEVGKSNLQLCNFRRIDRSPCIGVSLSCQLSPLNLSGMVLLPERLRSLS